jgi:hypothetical protein
MIHGGNLKLIQAFYISYTQATLYVSPQLLHFQVNGTESGGMT